MVLDVLVQSRRDTQAAKRLLRKFLKRQCGAPRVMITDKLASYGAAKAELMRGVEHRQHKGRHQHRRGCGLSVTTPRLYPSQRRHLGAKQVDGAALARKNISDVGSEDRTTLRDIPSGAAGKPAPDMAKSVVPLARISDPRALWSAQQKTTIY
jgi:DDE domain